MILFDGSGQTITLGSQIGKGGEGTVYEVTNLNGKSVNSSNIVAKLYHANLSQDKQEKLLCMARGKNDQLTKLAAWPLSTIHKSSGGQVNGFLMFKASSAQPIHHIYNPAQRKQKYPQANWAFLINVARNTAAAFNAIHSHGHVIGDVNPNLAFVSSDSTVKLIDCDSFQVSSNGKHFLCEVGVPHFTPPELQGTTSFRGVHRSPNHDNFGLALLIFHILLMGRHPFAGVYSGSADLPLEKAIAEFRYAYGQHASSKQMKPPPNCVTPLILPTDIRALFERAFTESGARSATRPLARDWVTSLDSLRTHLRTCGQDQIHKFSGSLSACPWCAQERQSNIYFFVSIAPLGIGSAFNLTQIWMRITTIEPPTPVQPYSSATFSAKPRPLPQELQRAKQYGPIKKIVAAIIVLASFATNSVGVLIAFIIGGFLAFSGEDDSIERRRRKNALDEAEEELSEANELWINEAGEGKFKQKIKELDSIRKNLEALADQFAQEKQHLQNNIRKNQLQKFLSTVFIANYNIPNIGPARKATLMSFGIETAADVSWNIVINIRGFGKAYTSSLIAWRKSIENRFKFDPSKGIDPTDLTRLQQKYTQKQKQLQGALLSGPEQLIGIKQDVQRKRVSLPAQITAAAKKVAQAKADMTVF